MELHNSPLFYELNLIYRESESARYYSYEAVISTEAEDIDVLKVISVDWIRDYKNAVTDEIMIEVALASGTYLKRIMPFKENLKMVLTKRPIGGGNGDKDIVVQEFIAILVDQNQKETLGSNPATATEMAANQSDMHKVFFQLQEVVYEQVRTAMVGGVPRRTTPFDLLISLLFNSINDLEVDVENKILGVNAVPPSNTTVREQIIIPHGVPLTDLAGLLQTQLGGIYSAGIGCYLQRNYWHVWPLYDSTRYDIVEKTALFIILPDGKNQGTERTYRKTDRHFVAVITGAVSKVDASEGALLNAGGAVRFADTNNMMESFVETKGNKSVAKRSFNNNEYVGVKRRTPSTMSRVSTKLNHSNPYNEASKLAARAGAFITMAWENSNPDLITPDLQCEIGFTVDGAPKFINGIVVHAHALSALAGKGMHQTAHQITTQVVVMVDRNSPEYQSFIDEQNKS